MNNRTSNDPIQKAIDTMDRDAQFKYLLPRLPNRLQIELMARWQEVSEIEDVDRRNTHKAAILLSMYGVKS